MGFFDLKVTCSVCSREAGLNRYQIANKGWICKDCFKECGFNALTPIKAMTLEEINGIMSQKKLNAEEMNSFNATKKVPMFLEIDDGQKKWFTPGGIISGNKKQPIIYNYSDILDFELLEDGNTITKGGIGRAIAGGVLFGGAGAVVGAITGKKNKDLCNSLKIKITVNDINKPAVYIDFIKLPTKKNGFMYKNGYSAAQECMSLLQFICNGNEEMPSAEPEVANESAGVSMADEILKYRNLMDQGIISSDEFEAKKKQLLNL